MAAPREAFIGRWRITSVQDLEPSDVDRLGPAFIEFADRNYGHFQLSALTGEIDYRISLEQDGPQIEWAWAGDDDGNDASGRGWAQRDGDKLSGTFFLFGGDDFRFEAVLAKPRRTPPGA